MCTALCADFHGGAFLTGDGTYIKADSGLEGAVSEGCCLATSGWPRAKAPLVFHRQMARRKQPCRPGQDRQSGLLPEAVSMDTPGGTCGPAPLCRNSVGGGPETFPANRHRSLWEHGSAFPLPTALSLEEFGVRSWEGRVESAGVLSRPFGPVLRPGEPRSEVMLVFHCFPGARGGLGRRRPEHCFLHKMLPSSIRGNTCPLGSSDLLSRSGSSPGLSPW